VYTNDAFQELIMQETVCPQKTSVTTSSKTYFKVEEWFIHRGSQERHVWNPHAVIY